MSRAWMGPFALKSCHEAAYCLGYFDCTLPVPEMPVPKVLARLNSCLSSAALAAQAPTEKCRGITINLTIHKVLHKFQTIARVSLPKRGSRGRTQQSSYHKQQQPCQPDEASLSTALLLHSDQLHCSLLVASNL